MSWGKGGMVGVGAAIHRHQKAQDMAAMILKAEHGKKHKPGERTDLCPICQSDEQKAKQESND